MWIGFLGTQDVSCPLLLLTWLGVTDLSSLRASLAASIRRPSFGSRSAGLNSTSRMLSGREELSSLHL